MPLQNRVDPLGQIQAHPARGMFTGNRGIIHDPETRTLLKRRWATKAWITCALHFKDVRRVPMGRNRPGGRTGWTELFFLDEVTALAAGHRPCFYCRREQAKAYSAAYAGAFGVVDPKVGKIDASLHSERLASGGLPIEIKAKALPQLPDGTMFSADGTIHALRGGKALRWSFSGYDREIKLEQFGGETLRLVTPATTLAVLREGYVPDWHPSAAP